ncbi:MAG: protein kinase [Deltaproteobacteria bacterium]|nr:protein kinase [Deltaproteobacteria bacterium]
MEIKISDRFDLIARVGEGAFGEVWKALDGTTGQFAAVKLLHSHLLLPVVVARFFREALALQRVNSPNVVRYLAHGQDREGRPWNATAWIDGCDLQTLRQQDGVDRGQLLRAVAQTCRGVADLHAHGLIHRDLKPTNVLVQTDGTAVVVDLGLARWVGESNITDDGAILGTPAFMAPEQVRGESLDRSADLWALGVMLYDMIVGQTPFDGAHAVAMLGRILLDPIVPVRTLDREVPSILDFTISKLLEKDRLARLSDAHSLACLLEEMLVDPRNAPWLSRTAKSTDLVHARPKEESVSRSRRDERRWIALVATRLPSHTLDEWIRRSEAHGARVEVLKETQLAGYGLQRTVGDEQALAARAALHAAQLGAPVALVAGWADVVQGRVSTGSVLDRVAACLDDAVAGRVLVETEGLERLAHEFVLTDTEIPGRSELRERHVSRPRGVRTQLLGRSLPMVGRDKELALLLATITESSAERSARFVLVVGEPGIGKSRLLAESLALAEQTCATQVLTIRGDAFLSETPHGVLLESVRQFFAENNALYPSLFQTDLRHLSTEDTHNLDRDSDSHDSLSAAPESDQVEAFLLLHHAVETPTPRAPAEQRESEFRAFLAVLSWLARRTSMVLAIEDAHWLDQTTTDTIELVFAALREEGLTIIAVARNEIHQRFSRLWSSIPRTTLHLAPLSERASQKLADAAIQLSVDERRLLAKRSGGNPLFLEELLRARAAGLSDLPGAIQNLLQARLDALGSEVKRVALSASIFGQNFCAEGVFAAQESGSIGAMLAALEREEIIVRTLGSNKYGLPEYAFRHALSRDAAYGMLVDSERVQLHRRAVDWLQRIGESDPSVLAHHFAAADMRDESAEKFALAAKGALEAGAFSDALERINRAISQRSTGPMGQASRVLRASALEGLGRSQEALEEARLVCQEVDRFSDLHVRAMAVASEANWSLGRTDEAEQGLRMVLEESHASQLSARFDALVRLAELDLANHRLSEAEALADEALAWRDDHPSDATTLLLRAHRVKLVAMIARGQTDAAQSEAEQQVTAATESPHRILAVEAMMNLAWVYWQAGDWRKAVSLLQRASGPAYVLALPGQRLALAVLRARIAAESEPFNEAIELLDRAAMLAQELGQLLQVQVVEMARATMMVFEGKSCRESDLRPVGGAHALQVLALRKCARLGARAQRTPEPDPLGPLTLPPELADGEWFLRWVEIRVLAELGRQRESDQLLARAHERLERLSGRRGSSEGRIAFVSGLRSRKAVAELWRERFGQTA